MSPLARPRAGATDGETTVTRPLLRIPASSPWRGEDGEGGREAQRRGPVAGDSAGQGGALGDAGAEKGDDGTKQGEGREVGSGDLGRDAWAFTSGGGGFGGADTMLGAPDSIEAREGLRRPSSSMPSGSRLR